MTGLVAGGIGRWRHGQHPARSVADMSEVCGDASDAEKDQSDEQGYPVDECEFRKHDKTFVVNVTNAQNRSERFESPQKATFGAK